MFTLLAVLLTNANKNMIILEKCLCSQVGLGTAEFLRYRNGIFLLRFGLTTDNRNWDNKTIIGKPLATECIAYK